MHLVLATILVSFAAWAGAPNQAMPAQNPASGFVNTLMPEPSQLSTEDGRLTLSPSLAVITDHYGDARLSAALARCLDRIATQTGISIPTSPSAASASGVLAVSVDGPGQTIQSVDEDESYSLDVNPSGARLVCK